MINARCKAVWRKFPFVHLVTVLCLVLSIDVSDASITLMEGKLASSNTPCNVFGSWDWTFQAPEGPVQLTPAGPWTVTLKSSIGSAGGTFLSANVQHFTGQPECDAGHGQNTATIPQLLGPLVQPAVEGPIVSKATAAVIPHGTHFDAADMKASVTKPRPDTTQGPGGIHVEAIHFGDRAPVDGSVENVGMNPLGVTLVPDYRDPGLNIVNGNAVPLGELASGEKVILRIPGTFGKASLTSLKVITAGSLPSDTTAAFLGYFDGVYTELDLDIVAALFAGYGTEFTYPIFSSDATNLFIGLDLTQWLSFPTPFNPFESFTFVDGRSDLLPGVFAATDPVFLGQNGFESMAPFSGDAYVRAIGDMVVPEPATLTLLGIGLAGLGLSRRQRKQ